MMLLALAIAGCHADSPPPDPVTGAVIPQAVGDVVMLTSGRSVIVPDLTQRTSWFGDVSQMSYHATRQHILVLDQQAGKVVEMDTAGNLLTTFGGQSGEGPGEIRRLVDYDFSESHVVLYDRGNRKTLVYARDGTLVSEFPVSRSYRSVALTEERSLVFLPGRDSSALDRLDLDGNWLGSIGERSDLPDRCPDAVNCDPRLPVCTGCRLISIAEAGVVIANREQLLLSYVDYDGSFYPVIDFSAHELLRSWQASDEQVLNEMQESASPNEQVLKTYFTRFSRAPDGKIAVAVVPSAERLRRIGYELWLVDVRTGEFARVQYPTRTAGYAAAVGDDRVFALDVASGGIRSFAF